MKAERIKNPIVQNFLIANQEDHPYQRLTI